MSNHFWKSAVSCLAAALLSTPFLAAQNVSRDRLAGPFDISKKVRLTGHLRPEWHVARDLGVLAANRQVDGLRLVLSPSPEQQAALERFVEEQRNPVSADYQNWLTPEQFAERFGASENDYARLVAWLEAEGFHVDTKAHARNWIAFSGTAADVARTFQTELHTLQSSGELHYANLAEPAIPAAFAGLITQIRGLDDFKPKPMRILHPSYTGSSGGHYLAPDDLAMIYDVAPLYKAGFDGTGQKLVIAGQTAINLSDIRSFRSQFGLPARDPQLVLTGKDPGISSNDQVEANLDLEWSGAVARGATVIYVYSTNVFTSVQYALDQNLAPVISLSYGGCESAGVASFRNMALQANAEGITWMNSSGDQGAAGCDYGSSVATHGPAVIFPADIPEVTAVGGTEFAETSNSSWSVANSTSLLSATGYIPEKAWNDTTGGGGIWASGGGVSTVFAKPWWQTGPGVPNDKFRDVPDVSLTASGAHDGYLIYSGGLMSVGGTSASSPAFAGIVTILNQYLVSKGILAKPGLGNINPNLYSLAQSTPAAFHDITSGDNIAPCTVGSTGCTTGSFGYKAGAGYDLVTGLGSVDAYNLVTMWNGAPTGVGTAMTLAAAPASIAAGASTVLTAKATAVSGAVVPSGTVTFSLAGKTLGTSAVTSSGTASLTVQGSALAGGANSIQAVFTPAGAFQGSSATVTVTVNAPVATSITLTVNSPAILQSASLVLSATVSPAQAVGTVTFSLGSTVLGTSPFTGQPATLTVSGAKLSMGTNHITASIAPTGTGFAASTSAAVAVTVSAPHVATSTVLAASPNTLAVGATSTITATVKPASGSAVPNGTVTFTSGTTALGSATLSSSGTASITVKPASSGTMSITAAYTATSSFDGSSGTVALTVTAPASATTLTLTPSPALIPASGTSTLTAALKPATATGTVVFSLGKTMLGSVPVSNGAAALSVKASALATGANTITATYNPTGSYTGSTATAPVTVQPALIATTLSVNTGAGSVAANGTTQIGIKVVAVSGTAAPSGAVQILSTSGTVLVSGTATNGAATLPLPASSLAVGANTLTAVFLPGQVFDGSSSRFLLTVTASAAGTVSVTATPASQAQTGLNINVQIQDLSGNSSKITGMTINGSNFTPAITAIFGTTQLGAKATLKANLQVQWNPMPSSLVFSFTGIDSTGHTWTQTVSMLTTMATK